MSKKNINYNVCNKLYFGFYSRLFLNILLFIFTSILIYIFILKSFSIQSEKKFNYTDKSNIDYKIYLKENDFYENEYLDKDMLYIANLIDKINIDFDYKFNSDIDFNLDFRYSIIAKLLIQDLSGKNTYYEKKYILFNDKNIILNNSNIQNINESISIDYDYYNDIANKFRTNYGVNTSSKLVVYLSINKNSLDNNIKLNDLDLMSVEIPLSERSIKIGIDCNEINNTRSIIKKNSLLIANYKYLILLLISFVLLLNLIVRIIRLISMLRSNKSKYDKYVERLLIEYDRMIVETTTAPNINELEIIEVNKFQELVDMRDNLKLPIIYYLINKHQKCWFYIIYDHKMYLHIVKAVDLEENKK